MALIKLHTPRHFRDNETVTEFEANDISHIVSEVDNDDREGTYFYIRGVAERQYCDEPAKEVKRLIAQNKDAPRANGGTHFHFPNNQGAVQIGDGNVATVKHGSGEIAAAMLAVIQECRELFDTVEASHREQAKEMLDIIQAQIKSPAPSESKVRSAFQLLDPLITKGTKIAGLIYDLKTMCSHVFKHLH
jgi:hypothetical protein